jgi:hypothetical protein
MQEEKDKQIKSVLMTIMNTLHTYTEEELPTVYGIIKNSYFYHSSNHILEEQIC